MTKITDLSALTGASVDAANDLITVVDVSEAGAARNKKMTFAELLVGVAAVPLAGGTMTGDLVVPDEAYDATAWNGSNEVPTKNAIRDKIESLTLSSTLDGLSDVVITGAAQGDVIYFNGTNFVNLGAGTSGQYLKTQGTGANPVWATVSGGSGAWRLDWVAGDGRTIQPTSNYATLDTRNGRPVYDFDTTTSESLYLHGVMPDGYGGNGITFKVSAMLTSATTGTLGWTIAFERFDAGGLDGDTDSFATAQTITATTVPGTSGQLLTLSVNVSNGANMDSLAAGENFRIKLSRDTANDTATGDAEFVSAVMVEQ